MVYSVKRKKLHAHTCKKYPRTCLSTMTKSAEFFLFTVVFLQPFALSTNLMFGLIGPGSIHVLGSSQTWSLQLASSVGIA